jgi:hypothetical protein
MIPAPFKPQIEVDFLTLRPALGNPIWDHPVDWSRQPFGFGEQTLEIPLFGDHDDMGSSFLGSADGYRQCKPSRSKAGETTGLGST